MAAKKGNLSISSENIFPIIKKWVYSDHDIFARELVSNGCDAITKLKKLDMMGEYQLPDDYKPSIKVEVNPEEKTLKFTDNGLGMTAEQARGLLTGETKSTSGKGSGIGVKNVNERIRLYFGEDYGLTIHSEPDVGTRIQIHLPAVPYEELVEKEKES